MPFRRSRQSYRNPLFSEAPRVSWIRRHRWFSVVIGCVVLAGITYLVYGLPTWRVTALEVRGNFTLPVESLREVAKQQLRGRWLLFFNQSTLWAFDTAAFERRLRERWIFSELLIQKRIPNTLVLTIAEELPAYTFSHPSGQFSVSRDGIISTPVSETLPNTPVLNLATIPETIQLEQRLLPIGDATFTWNFLTALRQQPAMALQVTAVTFAQSPDPTVRFQVAGEWEIVTDKLGDVQRQIAALTSVYEQKLSGKDVEYVDVSVPSRVYVK